MVRLVHVLKLLLLLLLGKKLSLLRSHMSSIRTWVNAPHVLKFLSWQLLRRYSVFLHASLSHNSSRRWLVTPRSTASSSDIRGTRWSDIHPLVSTLFFMELLNLSLNLCLGLGFVHALRHQNIHQQKLLLLWVFRFRLSCQLLLKMECLSWCESSFALFLLGRCPIRFCTFLLLSIRATFLLFFGITDWVLLLPWLVTIVDDKSRLVHIHMAWGCRIIQICGAIRSVTVLPIGFTLRDCQMACEGLLNLLLVLLT